jgi:cation diffusion facilitator CzcD-associated flavoprotein CzcO
MLMICIGQAGLNTAARLQNIGVSCLLVDRNARVGDNWRSRYRTLVTHDPVQYTHMYGLPFPPSWPLFTPKDKLGDWFEAYASLMELNVWTSVKLQKTEYSDAEKKWTVELVRGDGTPRTLKPKHVVFCTGHAGEPKIPTFPGQETFKGTVYHGSQHQDATEQKDVAGKKVIIVGTGNSGHDMAQNFYEAGAQVTMLQRSGTYVIQADKGLFMLHEGLYDETGPNIEDADVYGQSLPIPVQFVFNQGGTAKIAEVEKENLEGLAKAGFKVDFGHDGSGIYRKYITRGGGYYIDIGGSQLIIDGKIKVEQSPEGIKGFEPDSLILADGRKLDADIVVLATGYDNMRTTLRKVMGDTVADRALDVWDLDEEGEVNAVSFSWSSSGVAVRSAS